MWASAIEAPGAVDLIADAVAVLGARPELETFCHWALVSKSEETVRGSCFCSWCARRRPTGCGKRRQRVPISKAEFSSQVSSGIPLAPSPADPSRCREAQSDSGGGSIAGLAVIGETEVGAVDPHAMENDADFAGERDLGPFGAAAFGDRDGPGLELRPRCDTGHHD